jgi:hypothetical protein
VEQRRMKRERSTSIPPNSAERSMTQLTSPNVREWKGTSTASQLRSAPGSVPRSSRWPKCGRGPPLGLKPLNASRTRWFKTMLLPSGGETDLGKAQKDQAQDRRGTFLGLEPGICAELVGGIPQALFERRRRGVFFTWRNPAHASGPQTGRTVVPGHYGRIRSHITALFAIL